MGKYPYIEVDFVVAGKDFNINEFTEKVGILPSKTRDIEDWPDSIKNNKDIPEELQPRYLWCICQEEEFCAKIEIPIRKIMERVAGKEEIIIRLCKENNLMRVLSITVQADAMSLPEIVLSPDIVSYFGKLDVEIGFDVYAY